MKKCSKLASLFAMLLIALVSVACKLEPTPVDTTAPSDITELVATAKDSRVLLTWTDALDNDIFGYEVSYSGTGASKRTITRTITALEKNSMIVPQGRGRTYVSSLENGITYTFTVKTMDTSGNKSEGLKLFDMSGNVSEWCWDLYSSNITSSTPKKGADSSSNRCLRGGSFFLGGAMLLTVGFLLVTATALMVATSAAVSVLCVPVSK